jgi:putrescine importer
LRLWDLILYGVIVIQPVAPMSPFGAIQSDSRGHAVTAILLAMFAMLITAFSYGRMAAAIPSAGSAFTYVGRTLHPALGFVTGWSMLMDYVLNPVICVVWCSKAVAQVTGLPYAVWAAGFALLFTGLNLRGVRTSARFNALLAAGMGVVIVAFFVAALRYIGDHSSGTEYFLRPFFDRANFQPGALLTGTSLAVLTYIGFDGISTLAEEVENPRRNVLLATVLSCLCIGLLAAAEVYAAQLIWPPGVPYASVETAFVETAGRAGGPALFMTLLITLTVANVGSGAGAHLGAARLLYGMGRSGALPPRFFAALDPRAHIPRNNVLLIGGIAFVGAMALEATGGFELGAHLLNFGALLSFMGVNLACLVHYALRPRAPLAGIPPLVGFAVCLLLWLNLRPVALIAGGIWLVVGLIYGAWKTGGFRQSLIQFEAPPDDGTGSQITA